MIDCYLERIRKPKGIICTVALSALAVFLIAHYPLFSLKANAGSSMKFIWCAGFFAVLVFLVFTYVRYMAVPHRKGKRTISVWQLALAAVFHAATWHFGVEIISNNRWRRIALKYNLMSLGICIVFFLVLFLLFNSIKAAVGIGSLFFFLFGTAQYYTSQFRGIPLLFYDLLDVGAAAEVAGNYDFDLTKELLLVFYFLLLIYMNYAMSADRGLAVSKRARIASRITAAALLLVTVVGIGRSAAFSKAVGTVGMPLSAFHQKGAILCFIQTIKNAQIHAPEGYSVESLKETAAPYMEMASSHNAALPEENARLGVDLSEGEQPNIIVIMDEAFADIDIDGSQGLKEIVMPNYTAIKENAIKGKVMVSTFGGGTGRSEFEYNTGGCLHLFSLSASPYGMFGQRMQYALASQLKAQGYHTVAIHPFSRTNYNRDRTYSAMGFDEFIVLEPFKDAKRIRDYIADEPVFEKICDMVEEAGEPLFTFCVTMQNHGGYDYVPFDSTVDNWDGAYPKVSQYLTLIQESDRAMGEMLERFKASDEKTLVVFFGDHFPSLPNDFYKTCFGLTADTDFASHQLFYQTPYFIWANYDIPEADGVTTSLNYLGTTTLQMAGSKLTPWQEYLLDLQKEIPAFSGKSWYGKDGRWHEHNSDEPVAALINTYDSFQYNELVDKNNTLDGFFGP